MEKFIVVVQIHNNIVLLVVIIKYCLMNSVMNEVFVMIELIVLQIVHCVRPNVNQEHHKPVQIIAKCHIVAIECYKPEQMNNVMMETQLLVMGVQLPVKMNIVAIEELILIDQIINYER